MVSQTILSAIFYKEVFESLHKSKNYDSDQDIYEQNLKNKH